MTLKLLAKNKLGFDDGTVKIPDIISAEYKHWERYNNLIISWVIANLDDTIVKSVLLLQTTRKFGKILMIGLDTH